MLGAANLRVCAVQKTDGGMTMTYTKAITLLDGAMGTMLQRAGLKLGDRPETLSHHGGGCGGEDPAAVCTGGNTYAAGQHLLRQRA